MKLSPVLQRLFLSFETLISAKLVRSSARLFHRDTSPIPNQTPTSIFHSKISSQCNTSTAAREIHGHIVTSRLAKDASLTTHSETHDPNLRSAERPRKLLEEMPQRRSHWLGAFALASALKASSVAGDLRRGRQAHAAAVVAGFATVVFVANTLVAMYAKCGEIGETRRAFDAIPNRDAVSWNALLSCYLRRGLRGEAVELFVEMVASGISPDGFSLSGAISACTGLGDVARGRALHGVLVKLGCESDPFSANTLVNMYSKVGVLGDAILAFRGIVRPDTVAWNAVIAGCVRCEDHDRALELIADMAESRVRPDLFTFSSALKVCAALGLREFGRKLHCSLMKTDAKSDVFIDVGLIDMYSKCEMMNYARTVHSSMPEKSLIAWNAVISGHSLNGQDEEAIRTFSEMSNEGIDFNHTTLAVVLKSAATLQAIEVCEQLHSTSVKSGFRSNPFVANSLVDSYAKCSQVNAAARVFKECRTRDLAAFTSMAAAYAQCDRGEEALKLYSQMQGLGMRPDSFLFSSLLNACASLSAYEQGRQVHAHVLKLGFASDTFAGNSLVNMYAKCGSIDDADRSFSEIPERGTVSWSAMIGGFAQHGQGRKALDLFQEMLKRGVRANHITLVSVLCACSHAGLVTEAKIHFESMKDIHGIEPTQEHYACMVDLLGRAGRLSEATALVEEMPFKANASVWGALLGAARIHKDAELGRRAAEALVQIEPEKSGTLVILANLYASAGRWDEAAAARRLMRRGKVKKEPGISWVEARGAVRAFAAGEAAPEIVAKLEELKRRVGEAGYVAAPEVDLPGVDRSEKERELWRHSERLAVAFGLIATPAGAAVRVMKNLRVCSDCHAAIKLISLVVSREIILRDVNRFHHFKDGSCSCGDYW